MSAYYNEFDPFAAAWLRELIRDGQIAPGEVDERDIREVQASDLAGFVQCHWFAGIGGWSLALRLAGWPDDRPVWTGSCPCQPFSAAGAGLGGDDPRHLWPAWVRLIRECRPHTVFGEQVEAAIAHGWLDLVCDDLEREGYATGAVSLPACSVGAPHIRQRLWWVADAQRGAAERHRQSVGSATNSVPGKAHERERLRSDAGDGGNALGVGESDRGRLGAGRLDHAASGEHAPERQQGRDNADPSGAALGVAESLHPERRPFNGPGEDGPNGAHSGRAEAHGESRARGQVCRLADPHRDRREGPGLHLSEREPRGTIPDPAGTSQVSDGLGDTLEPGLEGHPGDGAGRLRQVGEVSQPDRPVGATGIPNPWSDLIWLPCRDGKARPVEPSIFPLAHGVSNRVGLLRGAGNAIVSQVAAHFIQAYCEVTR